MIIQMSGTAQEMLEFVKGMQFPVVDYAFGTTEDAEAEANDQDGIEKDVERLVIAAKKQTGEDTNRRTMPIEMHWMDLAALRSEANKRGLTACELAENIITAWLDKQKKARV